MAVNMGKPVRQFQDWYKDYDVDTRTGCLGRNTVLETGNELWRQYTDYKREMDARVANFHKLEKLADGEVVSTKPDLPNISSGETAGLVRRIARNLVQNTPNVDVVSVFDDDSIAGIISRFILTTKIIGIDEYSNDMQQNLFASVKAAFTLGFDCVIPALLQDAANGWYMKYDSIHYRDVFPEPGAKDVRQAVDVFVRRYLTKGEIRQLLRDRTPGWDHNALYTLLQVNPGTREAQSVSQADRKAKMIPEGYEVITWYSSSGEPFLTFSASTKHLLRIEKNKHPLKQHPVHFLVLEKDDQQPLGKSQVELIYGRQEFQDLMLNGAMKLWYRNINPSIIGYGAPNAVPNLTPGKYTPISNPNARIEPFEINTGTLQQYGLISQQNLGSMVNLIGAADQQMATQAGNGMSATPQGVEAQQAMVDITTNNYQKAIEAFFSHYCAYALTIFFAELAGIKEITPTADARKRLLDAGVKPDQFKADGSLEIDFSKMAVEYFVRCVPGSLVEMEDEKQMRILNQLFVPLSQAMPAIAASQDQEAMKQASQAMQYIIEKQIELSGSSSSQQLKRIWRGEHEETEKIEERFRIIDEQLAGVGSEVTEDIATLSQAVTQMQSQMSQMHALNTELMKKLGVLNGAPTQGEPTPAPTSGGTPVAPPKVVPASA